MKRNVNGWWSAWFRRGSVPATATAIGIVLLSSCVGPAPIAATGTLVAFNKLSSLVENGNLPTPNPVTACGSATSTFLAELQNTNPLQSKVPFHWGDIVSGKDMMVQGTVQNSDFGNDDVPFDHPFGGDMSMDVAIDQPYMGLGGSYGPVSSSNQPPDVVHVEVESGLFPHIAATPGPATGQNWQDAANADDANVMGGFGPQPGDRVILLGRWVLDCGHPDFHTEIHPITFMALARTTGTTTQVFTFYDPYHESQLYNPDTSIASNVADASRLTNPNTQPFPGYLVSEILRAAHVGSPGSPSGYPSSLVSSSLEEANADSPALWYACAQSGDVGKHLAVSYDMITRPGVTVSVTPNDSTGCAAVSTVLGPSYVPQDPVQRECNLPWSWLNDQAAAQVGSSSLNLQQIITSDLPSVLQSNTFLQQALQQEPVANCYDPLSAPAPDVTGTSEQSIVANGSQPFPFYGWISVNWGS